MTKLQSIVAEIESLPVEEQQELVSMVAHLASKGDIFKLSAAELAELDKRLVALGDEPTFSIDEALSKFVS